MKAGARIVMLLAGLLAACGADQTEAEAEVDADDAGPGFAWCGESRGALWELRQMQDGGLLVDSSALDGGQSRLRSLAVETSAPAPIVADLDAWQNAVRAWDKSRTDMPVDISSGRFVEPDTSGIDAKLMKTLKPIGVRVEAWVEKTC